MDHTYNLDDINARLDAGEVPSSIAGDYLTDAATLEAWLLEHDRSGRYKHQDARYIPTVITTTRPERYDIDDLCSRIAAGDSLRTIGTTYGVTHVALLQWMQKDPERYAAYQAARLERAHLMVDELLDLSNNADSTDYQVRRLQIDTRKWVAGKLYPKYYGDKLQTEISGELTTRALTDDQVEAKLIKLIERTRA